MDEYIVITATKQGEFEANLNAQVMNGYLLESWHTAVFSKETPYNFVAVMIKFGSEE